MNKIFLIFLSILSFNAFSGSVSVTWDSNSNTSHVFFNEYGDINIDNNFKNTKNIETKRPTAPNFISITQGCISNKDTALQQGCVDDFQISAFEVSNFEYRKFDKNHNSGKGFNDDNQPVVNVSKKDIYNYIEWLNKKTALKYRLPTKDELLYATLAGGTNIIDSCNNGNVAHCNTTTQAVDSYEPNAWGVFNSVGNVFELTSDNILFGGSWRSHEEKNIQKSSDIGFRLAI